MSLAETYIFTEKPGGKYKEFVNNTDEKRLLIAITS